VRFEFPLRACLVTLGWYGPGDWNRLRVNAEVRGWCERALVALGGA
jgi:hypothetical protein